MTVAFGQRPVAVPGTLAFGAGALLLGLRLDAAPAYASDFLPATMLGGFGVGLSFAALGSAAVAALSRTLLATGSAISNCFRQIGAVLGISGLVAVVGAPATADLVDVYRRAWLLIALTGVVAACASIALGRVRARHIGEAAEESEAPAAGDPLAADAEPS